MLTEVREIEGARCPYSDRLDDLMSNFDGQVNEAVAARVQAEDVSGSYPGWNFHATVWWDRANSQWAAEVWTYGSYSETMTAPTLPDLREVVSERYGWQ